MAGDGTNTYTWNSRDQLATVTKQGQTLPSFTYDAFGRRQKKTLGATITSYLYDGANNVQELTNGSPTANVLTGLGVDELFQRTEGATIRTFLSDALGSTVALADSAGVVQTSYTYAPYGAATVTGSASNNTSQYTGRENDNDGLYYYRARYYHPVMSRFVSEDPIGFGGGDPNLYRYAVGSPTNFTDPSGQCIPAAIFGAALDIGAFVLSGRKSEKTAGDWLLLGASIALDVACIGIVAKAAKYFLGPARGAASLLEKSVAAAFTGNVRRIVLASDVTVYRYWGGLSKELSVWFATPSTANRISSDLMSALKDPEPTGVEHSREDDACAHTGRN
jgi:RHS repeat-associated protein